MPAGRPRYLLAGWWAWGLAAMRRDRWHGIVGFMAAWQRHPGAGPGAESRQQRGNQ